jgi:hypothetical protein
MARRFAAITSIAFSQAMSLFDLGRIHQPLTVVGVDSDRLFQLEQQQLVCPCCATTTLRQQGRLNGYECIPLQHLCRCTTPAEHGQYAVRACTRLWLTLQPTSRSRR